jgi:type II secretory pathway pseudopilin PulG
MRKYGRKMVNLNHNLRTTRKGVTLLEIIIAIVLFVTAVTVMLGLFSRGLVSSSDAENTVIAINLAQRRMEEIRNFAFGDIVAEAKAEVSGFSDFQREVEVADPAGTPAIDDLKEVTVTVYWNVKGAEISEAIVTYISNN